MIPGYSIFTFRGVSNGADVSIESKAVEEVIALPDGVRVVLSEAPRTYIDIHLNPTLDVAFQQAAKPSEVRQDE